MPAVNASGVSSNSNAQAATTLAPPPATPMLKVPTSITKAGFQVNWTASAQARGYRLNVSTNSTFTARVGSYTNLDVGNTTAIVLTGLAPKTRYYVRLRAYSTAGTSANSATLVIITAR